MDVTLVLLFEHQTHIHGARQGQGQQERALASPMEACDLADFFGPHGPLARRLDGYELRPSQLEMAEAVKRALLNQQRV